MCVNVVHFGVVSDTVCGLHRVCFQMHVNVVHFAIVLDTVCGQHCVCFKNGIHNSVFSDTICGQHYICSRILSTSMLFRTQLVDNILYMCTLFQILVYYAINMDGIVHSNTLYHIGTACVRHCHWFE